MGEGGGGMGGPRGGNKASRRPLEAPAVFARVRPPGESGGHAMPPEAEAHRYGVGKRYAGHSGAGVAIADRHGEEVFGFPRRVFGDRASQEEVYREMAQRSVERVVGGAGNALVFAYGQTGTGKTHTILGPERSWKCLRHPDAGIFPRAVGAVFEHFRGREADFTLHASAIEFYVATCHDLLDDERPVIGFNEMHEPLGHSLRRLRSPEDLVPFMRLVQRNRTTRSTRMNPNSAKVGAEGQHSGSSRSHAAVILTLRQTAPGGKVLTSALHCVDMAGTERASSTGAERCNSDEALVQVMKGLELSVGAQAFLINFELSAFRSEIRRVAEAHRRGKKPFISKCCTTAAIEYFSQCLTGTCTVASVVCLSPAPQNGWETWFACKYGEDIARLRVPLQKSSPRGLDKAIEAAERRGAEAVAGGRQSGKTNFQTRFAARRQAIARHAAAAATALRELRAQVQPP